MREGLRKGLDIYGCETFYAGSHGVRERVADLLGTRILEMANGQIPFPDGKFDCVVNNQVFEHVEDLNLVLLEIARVLKPAGIVLSLFPSKEVIREGHCGVMLAHRLAKYPRLGCWWLHFARLLGFGYNKQNKMPYQWARDTQNWLNAYCFYRREKEILQCFAANGLPARNAEREYIRFRGLKFFTPWLFRKLGGMVLISEKSA